MSLQGSIETFALPDVLVLLSSTKKTGELRVAGGGTDGRLYVRDGRLVHGVIGSRDAQLVDTVFELLRLDSGTFSFDGDRSPSKEADPEPVEMVLADAQARLVEWREIEKVVPSLDAFVAMAPEAPDDEVVLSADHWRLLVGIAGGQPVSSLLEQFGGSQFEACRKVKELVDNGFATVDTTARAASKAKTSGPRAEAKAFDRADQDAEEKPQPKAAAKRELEPEPQAAETDDDDDEDRSARISVEKKPLADADDPLAMLTRPRKVRTQTSTPAAEAEDVADDERGTNGTPSKKEPAARTADEAQALVAQLAALGGADERELAEKVAAHVAEGGELPNPDEPINRGLLLKFLSSVRN